MDEIKHEQLIKEGWKTIEEPQDLLGFVKGSIPFMILNLIISLVIIGYFVHYHVGYTFGIRGFWDFFLALLKLAAAVLIFPIFHELLHLIVVPRFWKSEKTYAGLIPIGAFVYTEEPMTKWRCCILCLMPFFLISIVLNIILGYLRLYNVPFIAIILLNAFGSCVDMLSLSLLVSKVPPYAMVVNNGIKTYYRITGFEQ